MEGNDPENLYTGVSSAFENEQPTETTSVAIQEQKTQKIGLLPIYKDIKAFVESEKQAAQDLAKLDLEKIDNPTGLLDELRARKTYLGFLERFETWMDSKLNKPAQNLSRPIRKN